MPNEQAQIREWVARFKYPERVKQIAVPVLATAQTERLKAFESSFSRVALDVLEALQKGQMPAAEADAFFSLVDFYLDEYHLKDQLPEDLQDIFFDGHILHDYGSKFGPDLEEMRKTLTAYVS